MAEPGAKLIMLFLAKRSIYASNSMLQLCQPCCPVFRYSDTEYLGKGVERGV